MVKVHQQELWEGDVRDKSSLEVPAFCRGHSGTEVLLLTLLLASDGFPWSSGEDWFAFVAINLHPIAEHAVAGYSLSYQGSNFIQWRKSPGMHWHVRSLYSQRSRGRDRFGHIRYTKTPMFRGLNNLAAVVKDNPKNFSPCISEQGAKGFMCEVMFSQRQSRRFVVV